MTERDARLSNYLDGEISEDDARDLRQELDRDPELRRRLSELRDANEAVRGALGPIADEPVPERISAMLRAPALTSIPEPVSHAARFGWTGVAASSLAMAAGFLLAVFFLPASVRPLAPGLPTGGQSIATDSGLHRILEQAVSGDTQSLGEGWSATPRLTFLDRQGNPCRRIDLTATDSGIAAVTCRGDKGWELEVLGFVPPGPIGENGSFRPASGASSPAIESAIDSLIDGSPLDRSGEDEWIERGWKTRDR